VKKILQRLKHNPLRPASNRKGVALILAVTSLMFMVYIASEVTRDSAIEYIVNSQELNRLKTYYAARSGMQIALLRIKLFQQASRLTLPPGFAKQLDQIWKFPFAWPLPIPKEVNAVDTETMQKSMQESFMDSTYYHTIEDEGTKIDINDLGSPSKTLKQITRRQLLNIFSQKIEADEEFRLAYQNTRFEDLIDRITDWMSDSNTAENAGGDKKGYFSSLGEGYPPNRGFRTIDELRLVPGMSDEFFNILAPQITIYGMKAINPNTASKEILKSLDSGMNDDAIKAVIERRNDPEKNGDFEGDGENCLKNFKTFVVQNGANQLTEEFDKIPMVCDKTINFRIISTGTFGQGQYAMKKDITAIVVDVGRSAQQIKTFLDTEKKQNQPGQNPPANQNQQPGGGAGPKPGSNTQATVPLPKGPPRIVYWSEN
jgi:general secretion pathway protein K